MLATASTPAAATTAERMSTLFEEYSNVVDVVEAGADNTGRRSVTQVLRDHAADDTLLVFPPGRYYMDEEFRFTGFDHFGMVGNDATLVPANYYDWQSGRERRLFRMGVYHTPGRDLLVEGFDVDFTAANTGIRVIEAQVSTGLEVRDINIIGKHDSGTWGPALFDVMDPHGTGLVENFRAPAGGEWVSNTPNDGHLWRGPTGIMISHYHEGTVELRDCQLGGFPDNGVYAGNAKGTVIINRGVYANSHASNLRIGGHHSKIVGATVRVTENPEHFTNQVGVRLEKGSWVQLLDSAVILDKPNGNAVTVLDSAESALIKNCHIEVNGTEDVVNQGIVIGANAGPTYLTKVGLEMSASGNAIEIKGEGSPGEVGLNYVEITGDASGRIFRNAIRVERDNTQLRHVTIDQPGPDYRRAIELNGDDAYLYDCDLRATHHPIVVNGSNVRIVDTTSTSYEGYAGVRLNTSSSDVTLENDTLADGYLDLGCDGLVVE